MSDYDDYRIGVAQLTDKQKLQAIRFDARGPLSVVFGYSNLISQTVNNEDNSNIAPELSDYCKQLLEAVSRLETIIIATTDTNFPSKEEFEQYESRRISSFWESAKRNVPAAETFSSYKAAIIQSATEADLSIVAHLDSDIKMREPFQTWDRMVTIHKGRRSAELGIALSEKSSGFAILFVHKYDGNHWDKTQRVAPSLNELVIALDRWLVDDWSLADLVAHHAWMESTVE